MAQMTELLEELARLTGRHPEAVNHLMRTLRTSGHVQVGRRGVTSRVTGKSTANLLIALMSGAQPADTPRAVDVYGSLKPRREGGLGNGLPTLMFASKAATFAECLERLLLLAPRLKCEAMVLLTLLFEKVPAEQLLSLQFFEVEITLQRPVPYARMILRAVNEEGLYSHEWIAEWTVDSDRLAAGGYAPEMKARTDLRAETSITHKTLFRLGDLLAADDEETTHESARIAGEASPEGRGDAGDARQGRERKQGSIGWRESGLRLPQE